MQELNSHKSTNLSPAKLLMWAFVGCLVFLYVVRLSWRCFCAITAPISIFCELPNTKLYIDGSELPKHFMLQPFRDRYELEVVGPKSRQKYAFCPYDNMQDSGSITVDAKGVSFPMQFETLP